MTERKGYVVVEISRANSKECRKVGSIPREDRKSLVEDVIHDIGTCDYLRDFELKNKKIYVGKRDDGIIHTVQFDNSWKYGYLSFGIYLCIYVDKVMRLLYDCISELTANHHEIRPFAYSLSLINLKKLLKKCNISRHIAFTIDDKKETDDVVEGIKYGMDRVAGEFFGGQNSLSELIKTFESYPDSSSIKGVRHGDLYRCIRALLYYFSGDYDICEKYMDSWGDSTGLVPIEAHFRNFMKKKIRSAGPEMQDRDLLEGDRR